MKKVGVSLTGGGIKAIIGLGVMKALEDNGIQAHILASCSGGSLVTSLLSSGKHLSEIREIISHIKLRDWLDFTSIVNMEIIDHEKFYEFIKSYIGEKKIEEVDKYKVLVFATDVDTKEKVILKDGEMASAVLASCAYPFLYKPILRDGLRLVDGGCIFFYGTKHIRDEGAEVVIGVDPGGFSAPVGIHRLVDISNAILSLQKGLAEYEKLLYPIDIEINEFDTKFGTLDLRITHADYIDIGYEAALKKMDKIKELVFN